MLETNLAKPRGVGGYVVAVLFGFGILVGTAIFLIPGLLVMGPLYLMSHFIQSERIKNIPGPSRFSSLQQHHNQRYESRVQYLRGLGDQYGETYHLGPEKLMTTDIEAIDLLARLESPNAEECGHLDSAFHKQEGSLAYDIRVPEIVDSTTPEHYVDHQCGNLTGHIERRMGVHYSPLYADTLAAFSDEMALSLAYDKVIEKNSSQKWRSAKEAAMSALRTATRLLPELSFRRPFQEDLEERRLEESLPLNTADAEDGESIETELLLNQSTADGLRSSPAHLSTAILDADSLATPLRTALLHIAASPGVYQQLRGEIDSAAARGHLSDPVRHAEAAARLPYLQAVIRETLRVVPSLAAATTVAAAPVRTTRTTTTATATDAATGATTTTTSTTTTIASVTAVSPAAPGGHHGGEEGQVAALGGDVPVGGYRVPCGMHVSLDVVGVMRARRLWGADADAFRPERWLAATADADADAETKRVAVMTRVLGTQWGLRRREQEHGSEMAAMWMGKALVGVLRRFDFAIVPPSNPLAMMDSDFLQMPGLQLMFTYSQKEEQTQLERPE